MDPLNQNVPDSRFSNEQNNQAGNNEVINSINLQNQNNHNQAQQNFVPEENVKMEQENQPNIQSPLINNQQGSIPNNTNNDKSANQNMINQGNPNEANMNNNPLGNKNILQYPDLSQVNVNSNENVHNSLNNAQNIPENSFQNNNNLNNQNNINSNNINQNNMSNNNINQNIINNQNMNMPQQNNFNNNINNNFNNNNPNLNNNLNNNFNNNLNNNFNNNFNNNNPNLNNNFNNNGNNMINNPMNQMNLNALNGPTNNQINNMNNMNPNNQMNMINNNNNMGIQNMNVPEQKYSFSRYKKAARTGLKNLGDTSYFNSVLQLLATSRNLSSYFLNPKNKETFEKNANVYTFTYVFHRLFTHFYPFPEKENREIYRPDTLLRVLGMLNQVYKSEKRRNPNDLIIYCLNQLHREINQNKTKYISKSNPLDKNQVIKNGTNDFAKSNNSIISNNFHWFQLKTKHCNNCNQNFYEFKNFETFELDISEAFNQFKSPFTLLQCLKFQSQKMQNIFCNNCNNYSQFQVYSKIYSSPLYFIFSLNRGDLAQNLLKINVNIEEKIDISEYLENQASFKKFELCGIVSVKDNKYICFGKSPVDKQWYIYDDENVVNTNINEVIMNHNNNAYVPCILLYQFVKEK